MSIRPVIEGAATPVTVTGLSTISSAADVMSDEFSVITTAPANAQQINTPDVTFDFSVGLTTPAAGAEVKIYLMSSNTTASYGSQDDVKNMTKFIGSIDLAETTPKINVKVPMEYPFFKFYFKSSTATAASSAAVTHSSATVNNV